MKKKNAETYYGPAAFKKKDTAMSQCLISESLEGTKSDECTT